MSFRPAALFGLVGCCTLMSLLSACFRNEDRFTPRIIITNSASGGVTATRTFVVKGYALDDQAVTGLSADGQALPVGDGTRKIVNFEFTTKLDENKNTGSYTVRASDAAGHVGVLDMPVVLDTKKPTIKIKQFKKLGKFIRLSGIATDNHSVAQIFIDGNRINISPDESVEFYAETTGVYADLTVLDSVGNKATMRLR